MTIISVNVEGIMTNLVYIQNLIETYNPDIIAIQEHWLFNFEQQNLAQIHPDYDFHAKSVDDCDKIPPTQRPRGFGGICLLWKKCIPANKIPDGSERIAVLQMGDIITINAYLPCRGKYDNQEFADQVDQIEEICTKFSHCTIILAGDMNVDFTKHGGPRPEKLKELIKNHNLIEQDLITEPTYLHHDGKATSKIDYIFVNQSKENAAYSILPSTSMNTSPHQALILKLHDVDLITIATEKPPPRYKTTWSKGSPDTYQETLQNYFDGVIVTNIEEAIEYLINSIKKAVTTAFPVKKVRVNSKPKPWNDKIKQTLKESKKCDQRWKEAGSPGPPHDLYLRRKEVRHNVRMEQRVQNAINRESRQNHIMSASSNDTTTFYRLVKQQRAQASQQVNELILDDETHSGDLLPVWTTHFTTLAQPQTDPFFDDKFLKHVEEENTYLAYLCDQVRYHQIPITIFEVQLAIKKLKVNKAKDCEDLVAEHLIHGGRPIAEFMCSIINAIIDQRHIPQLIKQGILHPVHKRDKAINQPGNFRGITIVSIILKVLDIIRNSHQKEAIPEDRLDHQFGFTPDRAPAHATLLLNEAIAEARDTKSPLFVASLDIQKAFDVVPHSLLLRKLFNEGLPPTWWQLKKEAYTGMNTRVIWNGRLGELIRMLQGIIQGGMGSTSDFKVSIHDAINGILLSDIGFHIGSTSIGALACADDVVLVASSELELQQQLMLFNYFTNLERFKIHPTKSCISIFNPNQCEFEYYSQEKPWKINGRSASVSHEFVHLGINYNMEKPSLTANDTIQARLTAGRNTTYALMGAGLHGINGVNPIVSLHMYNTYVLPKITYSLEYISIGSPNMTKLEVAHRALLRNIQTLPKRTAVPALYILLGTLPIQAVIEQKQLSTIPSLAANPTILEIIIRQVAVKKEGSHSWVVATQKLLHKYNLPNFLEIIGSQTTKQKWKKVVKAAILKYWKEHIEEEADTKSSLKFLNKEFNSSAHLLWASTSHDCRDVRRANIKARLLCGTYILQATRAAFNQTRIKTCPLCGRDDEDITHFLLQCQVLNPSRQAILNCIMASIPLVYKHHPHQWLPHQITQLVLDPTHPSVLSIIPLQQKVLYQIEKMSRSLCYKLHQKRCLLLGHRY